MAWMNFEDMMLREARYKRTLVACFYLCEIFRLTNSQRIMPAIAGGRAMKCYCCIGLGFLLG